MQLWLQDYYKFLKGVDLIFYICSVFNFLLIQLSLSLPGDAGRFF